MGHVAAAAGAAPAAPARRPRVTLHETTMMQLQALCT